MMSLSQNNIDCYESLSLDLMDTYLGVSGLKENPDLEFVWPYLSEVSSVLEVGAGYGRVLNFLIDKNFSGKITAVEQSSQCFNFLTKKFGGLADLYHTNIFDFYPKKRFDAILWMWCGIADLCSRDHPPIILRLFDMLEDDGVLVIDSMKLDDDMPQEEVIEVNNKSMMRYHPSVEEIKKYSQSLRVKCIKHFEYKTSAKDWRSTRNIFFIEKE